MVTPFRGRGRSVDVSGFLLFLRSERESGATRMGGKKVAAMRLKGTVRARALAALTMVLSAGAVPATQAPAAAVDDACGATRYRVTGEAWTCSFVDNFNGFRLDPGKWVVQDTSKTGFRVGETCFQPTRGVAVGSGQLRLTVQRRTPFRCVGPYGTSTATYTGGAVSSWGKFDQAYGRFEARVRFPAYTGAGLHGGFWMNPKFREYGLWPASGEIDVAEWFSGVTDRVYPSLHYTGRSRADTGWDCVVGRTDAFHTYAVEWGADRMDFYYDGQLCFSRTWSPLNLLAPQPFDKPFVLALLASTGVGSNAPTSAVPHSSTTYVDYVKVWR